MMIALLAATVQPSRASRRRPRAIAFDALNPPAGLIGHIIAEILGVDPKSEMDDGVLRMRPLIETGKPLHDAAQKMEKAREASAHPNTDLRLTRRP